MIDLSARYLGLPLRSPLVASSSPLAKDLENLQRLEEAGAAAVVLPSLFEEEIQAEAEALDQFLNQGTYSYAEAQTYFPDFHGEGIGPKAYLDHIRRAKGTLKIPVIGSLNGVSGGTWTRYARDIEEAGADALELNVYFMATSFQHGSQQVEQRYCDLVQGIKAQVRIPVAVKLSPYFTSMANMARQLQRVGADGLVLFNRFYQPDYDLESMEVKPGLKLSTSEELCLRLHWVALLSPQIGLDLAITGGVHRAEDVVKGIMAGAHVVMLTSALLRDGISYLRELEHKLLEWMQENGYDSVRQMRGAMSAASVPDPQAFERINYRKVLASYTPKATH
jgi:dihydroorotate dehydrogenase (fumarate)